MAGAKYDYDLVIIGCGVGGHGAALHAVEQVCIRLSEAADKTLKQWMSAFLS
jgi:thioredoxin reductase